MITQVIWADVNNRELDNIYARSGDEEIREIEFIICRNDPPEKVAIPAGVSGQFRMIKSSGNFVVRNMTKTVKEDGTVIFTVAVSDQMVNVQGTGYYDIRLSGGGYLYTASGEFIVDSAVISSGVLEDVSEANELIFPDDFLTVEDHVAYIDDDTISTDRTWSSNKINEEIEAHAGGDVSKTVSGNPITFTDGAAAPLVKCVTAITGYQQGSGTPSPDNIRPIVAYTEGEIEVRGKNILNPNSAISYGSGSSTYSVSGNAINVVTSGQYSGIVFDKELPNGTYSISFSFKFNNSGTASVAIVDENNTTSLWTTGEFSSDTTRSGNFTVTHGIAHIRFYCTRSNASGNVTISNLMLNTGSSAENYEEYRGTTHTTTYPSAIYRGSEDVVNGEVTTEIVGETMQDLTWAVRYTGSVNKTLSTNLTYDYKSSDYNFIAEELSYIQNVGGASVLSDPDSHAVGIYGYGAVAVTKVLYIVVPIDYTPNGMIVYSLVTPTTTPVTPTNLPIKSLSGYNHIESSTGDMEVEYITERFQPLIDLIKQL